VQVLSNIALAFGGIGVDVAAGVLGGVNFMISPNDLQLYLLSGNSNPPRCSTGLLRSVNINSQLNAAHSAFKAGKAFGLDVNNGLVP